MPFNLSTDSSLKALAVRLSVETPPSYKLPLSRAMSSSPTTANYTPRDPSHAWSLDPVLPSPLKPYLMGDEYVYDAAILVNI
jgi:hypothetical protein